MEFLTLFSPTALGYPGTTGYLGQEPNACFMMYFGLIPLGSWVLGFFFYRNTKPKFWTWSALGWMLWMMGGALPLLRFIPESALEVLNPSKAIGIFLFAALTGAVLGLSRFFQARASNPVSSAICWGIALFWILDILSIPVRTVFPVADPFVKPEIQSAASKAKDWTEGQRMVSLHAKNKMVVVDGIAETFNQAADHWVGSVLANANGFGAFEPPMPMYRPGRKEWTCYGKLSIKVKITIQG